MYQFTNLQTLQQYVNKKTTKYLPAALFHLISFWQFQIAIYADEHVKLDLQDIQPHQCYHLQTTQVH